MLFIRYLIIALYETPKATIQQNGQEGSLQICRGNT